MAQVEQVEQGISTALAYALNPSLCLHEEWMQLQGK